MAKKTNIVYTEPSNYFPPDLMKELEEGTKKKETKKKSSDKKPTSKKKK